MKRLMPSLSIRWRLTIWYTFVVAVTLAVFGLIVYWYMGTRLIRDIDRSSHERALQVEDILVRNYLDVSPAELLLGIGLPESVDPFRDAGVGVRIYDSRGVLVDGSERFLLYRERIPDDRLNVVEALRGHSHRGVVVAQEGPFFTYTKPVFAGDQVWAVVQILTSLAPYNRTMELLARLLIIGTLTATTLAFVTGAAMAQTALAPIDTISRTARQIYRARDLSRRIETTGPHDEIGQLTETINGMLERIQTMFDRQRQFLADVSHELRTPLTTIRGEVDIMKRSGELDPEALEAICGESERMSRMIGDLLLLARAQEEAVELELEPVELDTLLLDVYRQAQTLAKDERPIRLGHEDVAIVRGDRDRLKQLFLNLVGNALDHTPQGTPVTLSLFRDGSQARVEVSDEGPGIPTDQLPYIFERFYRIDKARARSSGGGTGLGLAIVQWIAQAHGGTVDVESKEGEGTTFTVRLPLAGGAEGT